MRVIEINTGKRIKHTIEKKGNMYIVKIFYPEGPAIQTFSPYEQCERWIKESKECYEQQKQQTDHQTFKIR